MAALSIRQVPAASCLSLPSEARAAQHKRAAFVFPCGAPQRRLAAQQARRQRQQRGWRAAAASGNDQYSSEKLAELAALDSLIDQLMATQSAQEMAQLVGENIMSFDTTFWLRLAARSDACTDEEGKQQLASLARHLQALVEGMVAQTQKQMDNSSQLLQEVLTAGADPGTGEWRLPLAPERLAAMRKVMADNSDRLDEALLSTCYACIRKADQDKLDGMVSLLQKVLQLYAAHQLSQQPAAAADGEGADGAASDQLLAVLLGEDEGIWDRLLRQWAKDGSISEPALMEALQRRMEGVVLGLASGSYAQRVQAEYLKEVEERAKQVFADLAA